MSKTLGAVIGLAGILIGVAAQSGFDYLAEERAELRSQEEQFVAEEREARQALRVVSNELDTTAISLESLAAAGNLPPDIPRQDLPAWVRWNFPTQIWHSEKHVLAKYLGAEEWDQIANLHGATRALVQILLIREPGKRLSKWERAGVRDHLRLVRDVQAGISGSRWVTTTLTASDE